MITQRIGALEVVDSVYFGNWRAKILSGHSELTLLPFLRQEGQKLLDVALTERHADLCSWVVHNCCSKLVGVQAQIATSDEIEMSVKRRIARKV